MTTELAVQGIARDLADAQWLRLLELPATDLDAVPRAYAAAGALPASWPSAAPCSWYRPSDVPPPSDDRVSLCAETWREVRS